MKGQYMLIFARSDGRMHATWHKSEADALVYVAGLPVIDWMIIAVGDDGTQREPNLHPIVMRQAEVE